MAKVRQSIDERVFSAIAYAFLTLCAAAMLYPLLNVFSVSVSDYASYIEHPAMLFPRSFNPAAYQRILKTKLILNGYLNTLFVTGVGTAVSISLTVLTAYPLARGKVKGSRFFLFLIVFTMLFDGGIIPKYLVVRNLGLIDSLWAVILPVAMTPFNFLIMKANMEEIPESLEESARLDGAGNLTILRKIVAPLCLPVITALILFYGVAHWNRFFEAVIYLNSRAKWTMSVILREIITEDPNSVGDAAEMSGAYVYPKTIQNAAIIVTILPIMMVYPFVQRYFISGVMIGAVKG